MKKGIISLMVVGVSLFGVTLYAAPAFTSMTYYPEGIGSYDEWNVVGGDKISAVDNNDGDTTFLTVNTQGKAQTFTFSTPAIPVNAIIDTVSLYVFAKKVDAGYEDVPISEENNPRFKFRVENATDVSDGDEKIISNTDGYILYDRHMGENPFTGLTWTVADLTAAQTRFGIVRTNEGSETGIEPRVTKFWVDVLYSVPGDVEGEGETGGTGGGSGTSTIPVSTATFATTTPELTLVTFTASSSNATSTFSLSTSSPSGAVVDPVTGVFTWTPTEAQGPGVYTFDIIASSTSGVVTTTVTITVTELNATPTASDVLSSTLVNIPVTVSLLGADADVPVQTLLYTIITAPTNGTTTASGTSVLYTPNSGFIGIDTFTYVVSDGIATSSIATTTISVMAGGGSGGGGGSGSEGGTTFSGGGSSGGGSGFFVGSGPAGQVLGASTGGSGARTGQVLGASTCGLYLDKYLRYGYNNDVESVKKLQRFLNENLGTSIPVTGYYGPLTETAVRTLQKKYKAMMLTPWKLDESTGIVYLTTVTAINNIVCPELNLPVPTNLVPFSLHPDVPTRLSFMSKVLGVSMSTEPFAR